jgi:hypothetical protein
MSFSRPCTPAFILVIIQKSDIIILYRVKRVSFYHDNVINTVIMRVCINNRNCNY